jgi:glycosyltransferase involved in cell wall biosynthesis
MHAPSIARERLRKLPCFPPVRSDYRWEELSFAPGLFWTVFGRPFDISITCSYPFVHWSLQLALRKTANIFVTENGDWPARRTNLEYKFFSCNGLVCTNPEYGERHRERYPTVVIPNGIHPHIFTPGPATRERFGIPATKKVLLIVSALIPSKRVADGLRIAALLDDVHVVVAGDGPLRSEIEQLAAEILPNRFTRLTCQATEMPDLYRSADALLHMSREEAFGNIYIEALSCGLPVIAHDYPTSRWILGEQGFFGSGDNLQAMAAQVRAALDAPTTDANARHEAVATRFSWDAVAKQYEAFFSQLLRGKA